MGKKDQRVDAYINRAADFAKPILSHFRELVHKHCPDAVEVIKWGFPHFDYLNSPMCSMAAFKQHCAIGFWKAELMKDADTLLAKAKSEEAMGHFGKITSLKDLPANSKLSAYIKDAMRLNEAGIKLPSKTKTLAKKEPEIPDYFAKALAKNKKAQRSFTNFAPSHRKEYLQWVAEAKTEETRNRRLVKTLEWLSEGKSRNWKYERN